MSLDEIIEKAINGTATIQLPINIKELNEFAIKVAEDTSERIISRLHTPDKPISESEACKIYQRTRQTFSKYRKQGKIRYHLVGGGIIYFLRELEEDFKSL